MSVSQASPQFLFSAVSQNAKSSLSSAPLITSDAAYLPGRLHCKYLPSVPQILSNEIHFTLVSERCDFLFPPQGPLHIKGVFQECARQSIRTVRQQVLALRFIVISDPPSLTLCV